MSDYESSFVCISCGESFSMYMSAFLQTDFKKCDKCGASITGGKTGVDKQIEYLIKKSEFLNAMMLYKGMTGSSLPKTKEYIENLSKTLGVEFKTKSSYLFLIILSFIGGLIISAVLLSLYSPAVFWISGDILGISSRHENFSSFFIGAIFYGLVLFILLNLKRFLKKIIG